MRSYTDKQLVRAVENSTSWRGVLRALGLVGTSSGAIRSVRAHADRLMVDYSHFRGRRRWTDPELAAAVQRASTWQDVADLLGLHGGSATQTLRGHAARLGLDAAHLGPPERRASKELPAPNLEHLARAGPLLSAAWFELSGCPVAWPLEPSRYDLLVQISGTVERIQVKTTTYRPGNSWRVQLATSRREVHTYDPEEIDRFFLIDGDYNYYLVPVAVVGGLHAIHLSANQNFVLPRSL